MNVVFTGQTGTEKEKVIDCLITHLYEKFNISKDLHPNFIKHYSVENNFAFSPTAYLEWLEIPNENRQEEQWKTGFELLLKKIESDKPENVFVSMHGVNYKYSRYFSPINWDLIQDFRPDLFITLIDDVIDIWERINERKRSVLVSSENLSIKEILDWRSTEIMITDLMAKYLEREKKINNFVVAIKHPVCVIENLLLKPMALRIYAAYPITATKNDPARRAEIDQHRARLYNQFTVFDPITIDDYSLVSLARESDKDTITYDRSKRWPMPSSDCDIKLLSNTVEYKNVITNINKKLILEAEEDIAHHIEWRDFRLLNQSHVMAAYRPNFNNGSKGVNREIDYANLSGITVYRYWPLEDGKADVPFSTRGVKVEEYNKYFECFNMHQCQINDNEINPSHGSSFGNI